MMGLALRHERVAPKRASGHQRAARAKGAHMDKPVSSVAASTNLFLT
jgi:hypothetical protein